VLRLQALCEGCTKLFIDINGTREVAAVARLLRTVLRSVRPRVVVVKSRNLRRLACCGQAGRGQIRGASSSCNVGAGFCREDGVVSQPARWCAALDAAAASAQHTQSAASTRRRQRRERARERSEQVRRPLRPFWRPFRLRFTYVTSVLVKKY
jgi:hypothetical protein